MSENEFKALSDVLTAEMKQRENLIILPVTADKLRKTKVWKKCLLSGRIILWEGWDLRRNRWVKWGAADVHTVEMFTKHWSFRFLCVQTVSNVGPH